MKKIINKRVLIVFVIINIIMIIGIRKVSAAEALITVTSNNIEVNDDVKVIVKYTASAWNLRLSGSGIKEESYIGYTNDLKEITEENSVIFDTSKIGTYEIKLSGDITNENGKTSIIDKSITIKVSESFQEEKQNIIQTDIVSNKENEVVLNNDIQNNDDENIPEIIISEEDENQETKEELGIKELIVYNIKDNKRINELVLNPPFDMNMYKYTCKVSNEIEKIDIKAKTTRDGKIKIEGIENQLNVGDNIIKVIVQSGEESKLYTINVIKEAAKEEIKEDNTNLRQIENIIDHDNDLDNVIDFNNLNKNICLKTNFLERNLIIIIILILVIVIVLLIIFYNKQKKSGINIKEENDKEFKHISENQDNKK